MRILRCTTCGTPVRVHEQPVQFIDPKLYVCGNCQTQAQPTLEPQEEHHAYNPETAEIPY